MDSHKEKVKLKLAVEQFVKAMVKRLYEKVDKGYTGWDNGDNFFQIAGDMFVDVATYTRWENSYLPVCVDIANRAMMLYHMGLSESNTKEEKLNSPGKSPVQQTQPAISLSIVEDVLLKYFSPLPVGKVMDILQSKQQAGA